MDNIDTSRVRKADTFQKATSSQSSPRENGSNSSSQSSYTELNDNLSSVRSMSGYTKNENSLSSLIEKYTTDRDDFYDSMQQQNGKDSDSFMKSLHEYMKSVLSSLGGDLSNQNEMNQQDLGNIETKQMNLKSAHNSFVNQYTGSENLNNNNCGPACLVMIARARGVLNGNSTNAFEQMNEMRNLMGASSDENSYTTTGQIARGARELGLNASVMDGGMKDLQKLINNGGQAILNIRNGGGHAITVLGMSDGKFIIQDPQKNEPQLVSAEQLQKDWGSSGLMVGIS